MRKTLFTALLLLFCLGMKAQGSESPREVWCYLTSVDVKNARDFQIACRKVQQIFPSTPSINKLDLPRKIYLNKMRGCLKRGADWVKLTPKIRMALSEDAVIYTNKFIKWHEGMKNPEPSFAQLTALSGEPTCSAVDLKYTSLGAHSRDINYVYVSCMDDPEKRIEEKFWCVLEFLAAMAECDRVYRTYE